MRWQHTYEPITDQWIYASSTFDALVSMATFRLNEDKAQQATIVNSNKVSYKARNIYHPFLGEKAVRNNFDIQNHEYYIITGANMAGKSTFFANIGGKLYSRNERITSIFRRNVRISIPTFY